jgi:hypothetical protein
MMNKIYQKLPKLNLVNHVNPVQIILAQPEVRAKRAVDLFFCSSISTHLGHHAVDVGR